MAIALVNNGCCETDNRIVESIPTHDRKWSPSEGKAECYKRSRERLTSGIPSTHRRLPQTNHSNNSHQQLSPTTRTDNPYPTTSPTSSQSNKMVPTPKDKPAKKGSSRGQGKKGGRKQGDGVSTSGRSTAKTSGATPRTPTKSLAVPTVEGSRTVPSPSKTKLKFVEDVERESGWWTRACGD